MGYGDGLPIHDNLCHTPEKLLGDYLGAVKFGNIFSLDVGLDYAGRLREIDVATLRKVGQLIRDHDHAAEDSPSSNSIPAGTR